jgi:hypothetical protein
MLREVEAVEDGCRFNEAVQNFNIPRTTHKRRVPENWSLSNKCIGHPNALHEEDVLDLVQYLLYLQEIFCEYEEMCILA